MTSKVIAIGSYPDWDVTPLRDTFDLIETDEDGLLSLPEDIRAQVRAVAYKGHMGFDARHMDALPGLGLIANFGVGYDAINVGDADARNIRVTNTPDVLNDDVADLAVGMLLALTREIPKGDDWVRSGKWSDAAMPLNRKMSGRRAGIMGLGRIGREIADRLAAFKMEIHYHSRSPKDVPDGWTYHADPVSLAKAVDDMVVILVGGPDTENYVSREVLTALGPDGTLTNISRGSTVDEEALIELLQAGGLRGAALDVFKGEPNVDRRFLDLGNVLLQPHQGSATLETRKAMGELQRANVSAFLDGKPLLTPVN